jgi:hypothetical protein
MDINRWNMEAMDNSATCPVCGLSPDCDHETCRRIVREHFEDMQRAIREAK